MSTAPVAGGQGDLPLAVDRAAMGFARHWLLVVNAVTGIFALLPFLSPYLKSQGFGTLGDLLFILYQPFCHQMPERSFFIFGHQMSYCQRDVAIYTSIAIGGLFFALVRPRLPRLSVRVYGLLILPMAIDGFTQAFGWRESTWELRLLTGSLFGLATLWLLYPVFDRAFREALAPRPGA